jgi:uncharacterized protein (UPF0276 family)
MNLPELGVGITYFSRVEPLLESHPHLFHVLEIEPQTLWYRRAEGEFRIDAETLQRLKAFPCRKTLHGIGFPVGGVRPPDRLQIPLLQTMAAELDAPWISEHLSFNEAAGPEGIYKTGFLLPPRQTQVGVAAAAASIRHMAAELPVPFAVETGVNYLRPRPEELPDGAFVAAVVEAADCGLLLDLHNIWTNQRNGRQAVGDFLDQLPLERVWEVHLAGGSEYEGYWLDSHSGAMPEELIELALQVVPRLPNLKALIFELFPPYLIKVGYATVRKQLEALHRVWEQRGRPATAGSYPAAAAQPERKYSTNPTAQPEEASPEEWENTLGALVVGRQPTGLLAAELAGDPGVSIVKDLLAEFRASMTVSVLKLTGRYLMLGLGRPEFKALLADYWKTAPPQLFSSDEAEGFAQFLIRLELELPHLYEVLAFERAVMQTLLDGEARVAPFSCDPLPLLRALGEGRLPEMILPGEYEIEVTPENAAGQGLSSLVGVQT